jgi:DNA-binding HxlR family transcriptional regulator
MTDETEDAGLHLYCPIAATMQMLNGKWTLHILSQLMDGRKRFNEIARAIGPMSSRTLCCRLRALEEQGILVREVKNTIPPWVEYELTEKGRALNAVIDSIAAWGRTYMAEEVRQCRIALSEAGAETPEHPLPHPAAKV